MKELRQIGSRYEFQLENRQIILIVSGLLLVLMLSFLMGALFGLNLDRMSGRAASRGRARTAGPRRNPAAALAPAPEPAPAVEAEELSALAEPILGAVASREDLIRQLEGEKVPNRPTSNQPRPPSRRRRTHRPLPPSRSKPCPRPQPWPRPLPNPRPRSPRRPRPKSPRRPWTS